MDKTDKLVSLKEAMLRHGQAEEDFVAANIEYMNVQYSLWESSLSGKTITIEQNMRMTGAELLYKENKLRAEITMDNYERALTACMNVFVEDDNEHP